MISSIFIPRTLVGTKFLKKCEAKMIILDDSLEKDPTKWSSARINNLTKKWFFSEKYECCWVETRRQNSKLKQRVLGGLANVSKNVY